MTAVSDEYGIIRRFQRTPPVDVGQVAAALGLGLWESSTLPHGISGKIMHDEINGGDAKYSILVNSSESYVRKRFTVAHEIAHYILHRELIGSALMDDALYRSGLTTREEAQANRLAAEILMPQFLIDRDRAFSSNPEILAARYQVSVQAMRIRLGLPVEIPSPFPPGNSPRRSNGIVEIT